MHSSLWKQESSGRHIIESLECHSKVLGFSLSKIENHLRKQRAHILMGYVAYSSEAKGRHKEISWEAIMLTQMMAAWDRYGALDEVIRF